jgi:hypothetical protein
MESSWERPPNWVRSILNSPSWRPKVLARLQVKRSRTNSLEQRRNAPTRRTSPRGCRSYEATRPDSWRCAATNGLSPSNSSPGRSPDTCSGKAWTQRGSPSDRRWFADFQEFRSHGRRVGPIEAQQQGLNILLLEDDPELQDAVLSVHHTIQHTFTVLSQVGSRGVTPRR